MARFDVCRLTDGALVLDCQADRLRDIGSRFVIPLLPADGGPPAHPDLNPHFELPSGRFALYTELAGALRTRELQPTGWSLAAHDYTIVRAIDVLIAGF